MNADFQCAVLIMIAC